LGSSAILIVSNHPLFAEAITHILKDEEIEVVAIAKSLETALPLLKTHRPDTVIIDCNTDCLPNGKMAALLGSSEKDLQVIFLTLADNRMIVHYRQHLGDATPADLISVLREWPFRSGSKGAKT
jgi:DNA-binding NarL/FixJ family response regulator